MYSIRLAYASLSDQGKLRESNQDACREVFADDGGHVFIVADGMGGHAGGATASKLAVEAMSDHCTSSSQDPGTRLRLAFALANQAIREGAQEQPDLTGMGTTGVALMFHNDGEAWVAHVGDSRAYRFRLGAGLEQLTLDHSVIADLVRRGEVTPEEAIIHPRRSQLLRAIGTETTVKVDVSAFPLQEGDRYLLCSDGLTAVVGDADIAGILRSEEPANAVEKFVALANERGGPDNITVQVIEVAQVEEVEDLVEVVEDARDSDMGAVQSFVEGPFYIPILVVLQALFLFMIWTSFGPSIQKMFTAPERMEEFEIAPIQIEVPLDQTDPDALPESVELPEAVEVLDGMEVPGATENSE
ncbi:MAG: Stp1/IreP family PP2C-type Ser/Thr phosphatase [Deltaproteobacteria bacterium]|nr:Stp1/IreP family PP2C-type Ser/Thr phosphatase [Deltaproteobacteria bacterium]